MKSQVEIKGFCEPQFKKVEEQFRKNFENGLECGASVAVTVKGKYVVDLWAGYADEQKTKMWEKDTIVNVWSSTKVITALCIHLLVDRGLIDVEEPVATYWPEFKQNGKEKVLVRHLLRHSAGLYDWDGTLSGKIFLDWDKAVSLLEAQKPKHEPGTQWIYHAVTFGYLLGNLVKKITGKSIGTFFQEEIANKVNADFYIGLPEQFDSRVADLIAPVMIQGDQTQEEFDAKKFVQDQIPLTKTREWRAAEIPSANGHGNARSMARVGSIIACGGTLDGVEILSEETLQKSMQTRSFEAELIPGGKFNFGLGWMLLPEFTKKNGKTYKNRFFGGGWGGSNITMDLDNKICFTYAMNRMEDSLTGDLRTFSLLKALYKCL
jgi:CubicO group peptidase (beta-lactamase class C family)